MAWLAPDDSTEAEHTASWLFPSFAQCGDAYYAVNAIAHDPLSITRLVPGRDDAFTTILQTDINGDNLYDRVRRLVCTPELLAYALEEESHVFLYVWRRNGDALAPLGRVPIVPVLPQPQWLRSLEVIVLRDGIGVITVEEGGVRLILHGVTSSLTAASTEFALPDVESASHLRAVEAPFGRSGSFLIGATWIDAATGDAYLSTWGLNQ
jgi:hypothetical protein